MSHSNRAVVLLLLACSPACGRQVVHFLADGGADQSPISGRGGGGAGHDGGGASGSSGLDAHPTDGSLDAILNVGPVVLSTLPADEATGVPLNASISATFNEAMDPTTLSKTTFTVKQGTTSVDGAVTYAPLTMTVTFAPTAVLGPTLVYTATLTTAVKDALGVSLAATYTWSFTTAPDGLPPLVIATTPSDLATDVSINERPTATFSKAMDPATLNALTVTVVQGLTPVPGAVTLDGQTNSVTFAPSVPLGLGLAYTVMITTGAEDLGGQPLVADYSWGFSTATCSLTAVDLKSAAAFAVLAGSTVTSGGPTLIAGDLGVSPGTAITGFPPGTVVGTQHPGDPTAAQGIADLATAYNDAKGRTQCAVTLAGNLGGLTLTPGLYTSTSSLAISAGDLTLDAQEDSDAIFIFQTASTLTTTVGRQVVLINGAKAANVFWQVGSSATFGTSSAFEGTIMADQTITLNSGATLNGRALAHIGAVNLASNTVVRPPE
jgi:Ice-binding-like/Bacterial Ig-like domain